MSTLGSYRKTVRRIAGNAFCPDFNRVTSEFFAKGRTPLECVKHFEQLRKQKLRKELEATPTAFLTDAERYAVIDSHLRTTKV